MISILEFCLQAGNLLSVQMEQRRVRTRQIPEIYLQKKPCGKLLQAVVSKTGEKSWDSENKGRTGCFFRKNEQTDALTRLATEREDLH